MSHDRTAEFMSMARGLPLQAAPPPPPPRSDIANLRNFHKTAANLSKDIAATSAMLAELTRLVRNKSLFCDDTTHVNHLVTCIKTNIENLNSRLEDASNEMESQKRSNKNNQASQEASNVVNQLQQEFCQATAGFKKVLQQRTDSLKNDEMEKQAVYGNSLLRQKQQQMDGIISLENKPPVYDSNQNSNAFPTLDLTSGYGAVMSPGESTASSSQLPRPHGARGDGGGSFMTPATRSDSFPTYSGGASTYYGSSTHPHSQPLTPLDIAQMESSSQLTTQLIPDQDYLRERAEAMETVETNIVELGKVFNKLATMVTQHREMVQRVEDNVDESNANINLSLETLTNTLTSLRTNKALFLKVFSVLVIFIILFITFFA